MTQDVNSKQEFPKDEPSNNMNTSTNSTSTIEALQCQIQPQFITLQNAFLPQQMPTITTADVQQVQTTTAAETGMFAKPFLSSTPMPQQILNFQGVPQQFIQGGQIIQNASGMFQVKPTMAVEGQGSLYLPNIQNTGAFFGGSQPIQINGQQVFLTANGQITSNAIPANFLSGMGQPIQIPTAGGNTLTIAPKNTDVMDLATNSNSKEEKEKADHVSGENQPQAQTVSIPNLQIQSLVARTVPEENTQVKQLGQVIPQMFQFPNMQQTIPAQIPISLGNGQIVYHTVQLPISALAGQIPGLIQPQMQVIPQYSQMANILTPSGQIQQVHMAQTNPFLAIQPQQQQQIGGVQNFVLGNAVQGPTTSAATQLIEPKESLVQQQPEQQALMQQNSPQSNSISNPKDQPVTILPKVDENAITQQSNFSTEFIPGIGNIQVIQESALNNNSVISMPTLQQQSGQHQQPQQQPIQVSQSITIATIPSSGSNSEISQPKFERPSSTSLQSKGAVLRKQEEEPEIITLTFQNNLLKERFAPCFMKNDKANEEIDKDVEIVEESEIVNQNFIWHMPTINQREPKVDSPRIEEDMSSHQSKKSGVMESKHTRRAPCSCPNCTSNPISDRFQKRKHICHIEGCNKLFGKTSHLKAHLRLHRGERPFECNFNPGVCSKRFTRSDELQRHLRTHSKVKPFKCPQCPKKFSRSDHLTKHIAVHKKNKKKAWVKKEAEEYELMVIEDDVQMVSEEKESLTSA